MNMTEPTADRPLVTFALFAYKQEQFIREAVEGAFSQTYSPLEIILSDDCSPDRTFEIMQEMVAAYNGPHKIILNRNEKNLGIGGHVNKVFEMASGELIVMAAGDDISLPERTAVLTEKWLEHDRPEMICSGWRTMDENGGQFGRQMVPSLLVKEPQHVQKGNALILSDYLRGETYDISPGACAAYACRITTRFRVLNDDVVSEDLVLFWRSLLLGRALRIAEPLIYYRQHSHNVTRELKKGPARFCDWAIRQAASVRSFRKDVDFAFESDMLDRRTRTILVRATNQWTRPVAYLVKWTNAGFAQRIFILFPMIVIFGSRRHKKFAVRNIFRRV